MGAGERRFYCVSRVQLPLTSTSTAALLAQAITSPLDYFGSLLTGLPTSVFASYSLFSTVRAARLDDIALQTASISLAGKPGPDMACRSCCPA